MLRSRAGLVSVLIHGCGLLLRLAFMLAILRWSTSSVLGIYSLLVAIEVIAVYLAGLEFHTFTTRRYALRPTLMQLRICASSHRSMLVVTLPLCAATAIGATILLELHLSLGEVMVFGLIVAGGSIAQEVGRFMVIVGKPVYSIAMTFFRTAAWQPLALPFIGPEAATGTTIIVFWGVASTLGTLWGLWIMRAALSTIIRPRMCYLIHGVAASRRNFLIASASVLQGSTERFVLQSMLGPAPVGVFSFFQTLANTLPALIQSGVLNVSLPTILTSFGQRLRHRFELLRRISLRSLIFSIALATLVYVAAIPLVSVTSHPEYREYLWMIPLLLLSQVLVMGSQPLHLALYGAHRDVSLLQISLASLALTILLTIVLVAVAGLSGAVLSALLGGALLALGRFAVFRHAMIRGLV